MLFAHRRPRRRHTSRVALKSRRMLDFGGMVATGHRVVEQRSLRYHAAIAERLSKDGAILERTRARVEEWIKQNAVAPYYADGWRRVLERPLPEIVAFLTADSERARAFRQVSPFAGVLSAKERWRLWAAADGCDDTTAT
jgi:hypothetical protein